MPRWLTAAESALDGRQNHVRPPSRGLAALRLFMSGEIVTNGNALSAAAGVHCFLFTRRIDFPAFRA